MPNQTILVVEDEEPFRALIRQALSDAGYKVEVAHDGNFALCAINAARPDLVITDMLMPDCDGIELINKVHARHPGLPVISMSGGGKLPSGFYLDVAHTLGATALLEKPFSLSQLLLTVSQALAKVSQQPHPV